MAYQGVEPMASKSEMNVVPLIDVLLVLLIIFMVTVPAVTGAVSLTLPQQGPPPPALVEPHPMRLMIDGGGQWRLDGVPTSERALQQAFVAAVNLSEATGQAQPLLHVDIHPDAHYQSMASALAVARNAGMERIGFVGNR
ncbi:biopolymer transporter ExbD [Alkalisalibacterium limincola]|uniref:Biopolymer transporter ExbD n=2 Tax=Alkalisalibacterium limincola TaxID=2699169 RepID=A0A5C8KLZ7_9GAMM|nr:biopolymer transporter ExbD [Alkalisalibacterium limincola]